MVVRDLDGSPRAVDEPQGEVLVITFQLTVPMANLRARSGVLTATGVPQNPVDEAVPMIEGRWVLPRRCVADHVLLAMGPRPAGSLEDVVTPSSAL